MQLLDPMSDLHLLLSQQGRAICVCYRKGSVLSVCNRLLRRTNWVKLTLHLPRNIQGRRLQASHHEYNGQTQFAWLPLSSGHFFFLSGISSEQVCKCGIWLTPAGLHSMPTTPKCMEHFCTLGLTSFQVGTNYLRGSGLHPDFMTEEKCQLSSFFPFALPSSFEADELCASAETKDHKWLNMGSCTFSNCFKKPGRNGSYQGNSCWQRQEQSLSWSLQFAHCTPARV